MAQISRKKSEKARGEKLLPGALVFVLPVLFVANPAKLPAHRSRFQGALLRWYHRQQRPLPWRTAPSLYRTVVSEFMLQQTQVATVLPYFDRWMRALPDFPALAAAPESVVLKLWEGLGYYSRARNLRKLAQSLAHRPSPPRTPADWRELPGVGPYTAAAITSISFGAPAAVVDGNVVRVLARLTGTVRRFRDNSEAVKHFSPLAAGLLNVRHPGDHNQAMMELGATVCTRAKPRCTACPVARLCAARRTGTPEKFPRFAPKAAVEISVARVFCLHGGSLLLRRGAAGAKRLPGLHELPEAADLGVKPTPTTLLATRRRTITRHRITEQIHAVRPTMRLLRRAKENEALEWVSLAALERITLSGPHRRWVRELLGREG
jgi:A/G-specific adenine glycosylase